VKEKTPYRSLESTSFIQLEKDKPQLGQYQIDYRELVFEKEIGKGAYGEVWKGKWRGLIVAIKKLRDSLDEKQQTDFLDEARVMSSLRNHPNVVLFMGVTQSPYPLCIVTEFHEMGSLLYYLEDHPNLDIYIKMNIVKGIALGMVHLHSENIIHRDLAARNILLTKTLEPKVSDFGLSRSIKSDRGMTTSNIGPLKWMSPEAMTQKIYSPASDVWSFGVLIFEIFSNVEPYQNLDPVQTAFQVCDHGLRLTPPENAPPVIKKIMIECFQTNPAKRPSFSEITKYLENP